MFIRTSIMKKLILFLFISLAAAGSLHAQQLMRQDLRTINVDQLSDNEILYYYNKLQQSGISMDQAAKIAAAKGMPQDQIDKLQARVTALIAGQKSLPQTTQTSDSLLTSRTENQSLIPTQDELINEKIFGSELFSNSSLVFEPNLRIATPGGYVLGPDDEVDIVVYGYSEAHYALKVDPEGFINIPSAGLVFVSGLTMDAAAAKIKARLASTIYKAIPSGNTNVQITLGNIRSIRVTVIGQAKKPGTYTLSSLSTVFNALYLCGGPSVDGSYRSVELVRDNKVYKTIDLYDFLLHGSMEGNVRLMDQDVVHIPYYKTRITLDGEIKRPGIFETLLGENLQQLMDAAGGFTDSAYRASVKVTQVTDKEKKVIDVENKNLSTYQPMGGDSVWVGKILNRFTNRLEIKGAVMRPGIFELTDGITLKQLIEKADGLREDAFLNRGIITRLKDDLTVELVSFDVAGVLNNTEPDIPLKKEDVVTISSIFDLKDRLTVSIQGEVRSPGIYDFKDSASIKDLVFEAGGFTEAATAKRIEVARRVTNADPTNASTEIAKIIQIDAEKDLPVKGGNYYLQPYDVVIVRNNPGYFTQKMVSVRGEVMYPGVYVINSIDEKLSNIISRAGGFKNTADPAAASLRRINKIDTLTEIKTERVGQIVTGNVADTTFSDSLAKEAVKPYDLIGINLEEITKTPGITNDLILEDGDVLLVPKKNQAVKVRGEVLFPTQFAFQEGKTMKYYIDKAGGFSSSAIRRKAFVLGANGNARRVKHFLVIKNYPLINAGDEIFVPQVDRSKKGLSTGELIGITSAVVSFASVVIALLNNLHF